MNEITICMFGAASGNTDDIYYREAAKLGEEIGSRGHTLVFGAGPPG